LARVITTPTVRQALMAPLRNVLGIFVELLEVLGLAFLLGFRRSACHLGFHHLKDGLLAEAVDEQGGEADDMEFRNAEIKGRNRDGFSL
jgi:hypothetical protein